MIDFDLKTASWVIISHKENERCTANGITKLLIKLFQRQKHNFSSDIILNIKTEENPYKL